MKGLKVVIMERRNFLMMGVLTLAGMLFPILPKKTDRKVYVWNSKYHTWEENAQNWVKKPFEHLKKGDLFFMCEADGKPVDGYELCFAKEDAYVKNRIWTVYCEPCAYPSLTWNPEKVARLLG